MPLYHKYERPQLKVTFHWDTSPAYLSIDGPDGNFVRPFEGSEHFVLPDMLRIIHDSLEPFAESLGYSVSHEGDRVVVIHLIPYQFTIGSLRELRTSAWVDAQGSQMLVASACGIPMLRYHTEHFYESTAVAYTWHRILQIITSETGVWSDQPEIPSARHPLPWYLSEGSL